MHIKTININGFKSYRDQTFSGDDEFHVGHNVVVGPNGSGKSNFFSAIQFVLSEKYAKLRADDRQALLHEGTGKGVMSAYVEIVFDNTDSRLPIDKTEVAIRRTIGLKKDEYRIDGKSASQREVMSLLESAGFSSSNPYYIVEQGKVSLLTTMKDGDRLELLKEVAGTRVYDERRRESKKILDETEQKKSRIEEVITYVDERLAELEKEKKDLKEFQKFDKERRALEYVLYSKEEKEALDRLDELELSRAELTDRADTVHKAKLTAQERLSAVDREINKYKTQLNDLKKEREMLERDRQDRIRDRTRLELSRKDQEAQRTNQGQTLERARKELKDLQTRIQQTRRDLERVTPNYERAVREEQDLKDRHTQLERRLAALHSKQGRKDQFSTARARDEWLNREIQGRQQTLDKEQQAVRALEDEITKLRADIETVSRRAKEQRDSIEPKRRQLEQQQQQYQRKKQERDQLANDRKEQWRQQQESEKSIQRTKEDLKRSERELEGLRSRVVNKGLQEALRIVREQKIEGVHGTVLDLLTVNDKYLRAVEVTAGNALFNLVVESDRVAAEILAVMNRQKAEGRVTFMPLNRLNPTVSSIEGASTDFVPLWQKVEYDAKFVKVFQQIFGKVYVCRDLADGSRFAREHDVNCVTLNGDQANRKGALTGGWIDTRSSRVTAFRTVKEAEEILEEENRNLDKIKRRIAELDNTINARTEEVNKLEAEVHNLRSSMTSQTQDAQLLQTRESTLKESLPQKERLLDSVRGSVKKNQDTIEQLRSELGTQLQQTLTAAEQRELNELVGQVDDLQKQLDEKRRLVLDVQSEKKELETRLNTNLIPREGELSQQVQLGELQLLDTADTTVAAAASTQSIEQLETELARVRREIEEITAKQDSLDKQIETAQDKIKELGDKLEELRSEENKRVQAAEERHRDLEKLMSRRKILQMKRDDSIARIRELGTIPSDTQQYLEMSIKDLMDRLHKVSEQLKKYGHVNKKALDQYEQFRQQKDDFEAKKEELDKSKQAIDDLIDHLDNKKDEAINRTFKQVSMFFSQIFEELVPGGQASLIMKRVNGDNGAAASTRRTQRRSQDDDGDVEMAEADEEEEEEEEEEGTGRAAEGSKVQQYTGIAIQVRFPGAGEAHFIQQLSGGQKTLVALTLIFAIQRCDPAPFYLFDEIDSALDAAYRTSVARMIKKQSDQNGIQFITTTFKTELVEYGDQFYGIQYRNKVSSIGRISKTQALQILQEEEQLQLRQQQTGQPESA